MSNFDDDDDKDDEGGWWCSLYIAICFLMTEQRSRKEIYKKCMNGDTYISVMSKFAQHNL